MKRHCRVVWRHLESKFINLNSSWSITTAPVTFNSVQGNQPTISVTSTGILTEGEPGELTCSATGYRPPVSLEWLRNGNRFSTGISESQSAEKADGTTDTTSVWTFTPTKDYNEDTIECRTVTTSRISPSQIGTMTLNVRCKYDINTMSGKTKPLLPVLKTH